MNYNLETGERVDTVKETLTVTQVIYNYAGVIYASLLLT